jgi:hypothetical protein
MIKPVIELFWIDDELEEQLEKLVNNSIAMDDDAYKKVIAEFIVRLSKKGVEEVSKSFLLEDIL